MGISNRFEDNPADLGLCESRTKEPNPQDGASENQPWTALVEHLETELRKRYDGRHEACRCMELARQYLLIASRYLGSQTLESAALNAYLAAEKSLRAVLHAAGFQSVFSLSLSDLVGLIILNNPTGISIKRAAEALDQTCLFKVNQYSEQDDPPTAGFTADLVRDIISAAESIVTWARGTIASSNEKSSQ